MNPARAAYLQDNPGAEKPGKERLLEHLKLMYRSRFTDLEEMRFRADGRGAFSINGYGTELPQLAAAAQLEDGDWTGGYYRNGPLAIVAGLVSTKERILQLLGHPDAADEPCSAGRSMVNHTSTRTLDKDGNPLSPMANVNYACDTSTTAVQMPVALGLARASRVFENEALHDRTDLSNKGKEIAVVFIGDSSMAEGNCWEAIAQAATMAKHGTMPLVIGVMDNQTGISVGVGHQVPHGNISEALKGFEPELKIIGPIDGWDYEATMKAYAEAAEWARIHKKPALVHTYVAQPKHHSSSGNSNRVKTNEKIAWDITPDHDPIHRLEKHLLDSGTATAAEIQEIREAEEKEARKQADEAWEIFYAPLKELGRRAVTEIEQLSVGVTSTFHEFTSTKIAELEEKIANEKSGHLTRSDVIKVLTEVYIKLRREAETTSLQRLTALKKDIEQDMRKKAASDIFAPESHSSIHTESTEAEYDQDAPISPSADIIAAGYFTLMQADPRIIVFGEDVAKLGGVQGCTKGLQGGLEAIVKGELRTMQTDSETGLPCHPALPLFEADGPREVTYEERGVTKTVTKADIINERLAANPALLKYIGSHPGFGPERVFDTAIAEATIVGLAWGAAVRGLKPIAELQYEDYVRTGYDMLRELATVRQRSGGGQDVPAFFRVHGHQLMGTHHTGSNMGELLQIPGLHIYVPRNAVQEIAMTRATMHGRDAAISITPLLKTVGGKERLPNNLDKISLPPGQSEVIKEGSDFTIVTYGSCCDTALEAANTMETEFGISVEVVDLQSLRPLDLNNVAKNSIMKTGKVLILDEDTPGGASAYLMNGLVNKGSIDKDDQKVAIKDYIEWSGTLCSYEANAAYLGKDGRAWTKPQSTQIVGNILKALTQEKDDPRITDEDLAFYANISNEIVN